MPCLAKLHDQVSILSPAMQQGQAPPGDEMSNVTAQGLACTSRSMRFCEQRQSVPVGEHALSCFVV